MKTIFFSLILPIYNEGQILAESITKITVQLDKFQKDYEIIFVEDKSTDGSIKTLQDILPKTKYASAIFHSKNQGRGKSVVDGILKAKGKICGFLDVDLEVSEKYIPEFIREVEQGLDLVVAKRKYEQSLKSISRVLASNGYRLLVRLLLNIPLYDTEAGYKFFNREAILPIISKTQDKKWFWDTEVCVLAKQAGLKIGEIEVDFIRKPIKKSTVRLLDDTIDYLVKIIKFKLGIKL